MEGGFADDRRVDHEKLLLTGEVMNNPWSSEVRVEGADAVIDRMYEYFKEIPELTAEEKSVEGKSKWSVIINYVKYYNREVIDKELEKLAKNLSNLERDNENARVKFEATKRDLEQRVRDSKDEETRKRVEATLKKEVNQNEKSAATRKTMSDKITANIVEYEAKKANIDKHDQHIGELSRIYSEFIRGYGDVGKIINPINYHGSASIYRKYVDDGGNTEYFFVVRRGLPDSGAYLIDHLGSTVAVTESDVSGVITDGDREINRIVIESSDKYEKCGECKYLHHLYSLEHNYKSIMNNLLYLNYDTIRNNYGNFVEFVEYFFTLLPTQYIYKKSFHVLNVYLYAARLSYFTRILARVRGIHEDIPEVVGERKVITLNAFPNYNVKNKIFVDNPVAVSSDYDGGRIKNELRGIFSKYKMSFPGKTMNSIDSVERFVNIILDEIGDDDFINMLTAYNYCFIEQAANTSFIGDLKKNDGDNLSTDKFNKVLTGNYIYMGVCFIVDNLELMGRYAMAFDAVDEGDQYYRDSLLSILSKFAGKNIDNVERLNAADYFSKWVVLYVLRNSPTGFFINNNEQIYTMNRYPYENKFIDELIEVDPEYTDFFTKNVGLLLKNTIGNAPIISIGEIYCPLDRKVTSTGCVEYSILNVILHLLYNDDNNIIDIRKFKIGIRPEFIAFFNKYKNELANNSMIQENYNEFMDLIQGINNVEYKVLVESDDTQYGVPNFEIISKYENICRVLEYLIDPEEAPTIPRGYDDDKLIKLIKLIFGNDVNITLKDKSTDYYHFIINNILFSIDEGHSQVRFIDESTFFSLSIFIVNFII